MVHVKVVSHLAPAARATCEHGRSVVYNLALGVVIHSDDDRSDCDGRWTRLVTQ